VERRKADKKETVLLGKDKMVKNTPNTVRTPLKMLKASSFQPHVGVTDKVNVLNIPPTFSGQGKDISSKFKAALRTINITEPNNTEVIAESNESEVVDKSSTNNNPDQWIDPARAAVQKINNIGGSQGSDQQESSSSEPESKSSNPHQALLASIKSRRDSLPSERRPIQSADSVPERIRHIDTKVARRESRVLLVNRMLHEAPASVKQDFLKGVTYKQTSDPILMKIYDTEDKLGGVDGTNTVAEKNWKAVDPRQEMLEAIRKRKS
jgi:hypothetical protein